MAWTAAEELRVQAIELMLNKLQTIVQQLASQKQLRSLSMLKQSDINALTTAVTALQSQVAILQKNSI